MSFCLAQPTNDMFANRILLTGTNVVATGSNVGATKESGEPDHGYDVGGASVWWEWTAPFNCTVTISTAGSSFDTLLGVYTGSSVSALTIIGSNDDYTNITSRVVFRAVYNQTYQLAVDGYGGDSGSVQLLLKVGPTEVPDVMAWGVHLHYRTPAGPVWHQAYLPAGLSNVVAVAAGQLHSLMLTAEGKVWASGYYSSYYSPLQGGQVEVRTFVPAGLSNVVAIAGGSCHSLALTAAGGVMAWGRGRLGQSLAQTNVPSGLSNVVAIAAGGEEQTGHSLALTVDGRVVAWGDNYYGQTNVPSGLSNVVAIAAGGIHSLALKSNGRVESWGSFGEAVVPAGLSNVIAIAAGSEHSLALTTDGRVVAWGDNYHGQTNVPSGLSNVVAITAGGDNSLALTAEGCVVAWGDNEYGQTNAPTWLNDVVAIAAGGSYSGASGHGLALTHQPGVPTPGLELTRGLSGLQLWAHGAPGMSCQLLRAIDLRGPWLPTQPVTFTNTVQLLRRPDPSVAAQFFRLLRR
jgi:hypothetical protein